MRRQKGLEAVPPAFHPHVLGIRQEADALGEVVTNFLNFAKPARVTLAVGRDHSAEGDPSRLAFTVRDMDAAYRRLRDHKVTHASSGPQTLPEWNKAAGGIRAFYFKDPDGHPLEILQFPPGKGDPRWQRDSGPLFLGIDHTAIVVADTDASLGFYRDRLGLRVAGESENYGIEQERLNNVFGARLRITSLKAAKGPAIEFLQYLAPSDGRPIPLDIKANDIVHWEIPVFVADADVAWKKLVARRMRLVSPGPQNVGGRNEVQAKDPDGHALVFRTN